MITLNSVNELYSSYLSKPKYKDVSLYWRTYLKSYPFNIQLWLIKNSTTSSMPSVRTMIQANDSNVIYIGENMDSTWELFASNSDSFNKFRSGFIYQGQISSYILFNNELTFIQKNIFQTEPYIKIIFGDIIVQPKIINKYAYEHFNTYYDYYSNVTELYQSGTGNILMTPLTSPMYYGEHVSTFIAKYDNVEKIVNTFKRIMFNDIETRQTYVLPSSYKQSELYEVTKTTPKTSLIR